MVEVAGNAAPRRSKMSEGELKGILDAKTTNALGYYGGKLSKARVTAAQYYNGEPFGNELDGRSQVVSRDVAEAVDSMMPSLMKIFSSGDEVVRFDATRPEDEEIAKQATDYINWIWNQQNEGFRNTYNWFKDSLINRTAAIKVWWDEQEEVAKESYEGLTDQEFAILMQDTEDEKLELLEHTEYPDPMAALALPPPSAPPGAAAVASPPAVPPAPMPAPPGAGVPPPGMGQMPPLPQGPSAQMIPPGMGHNMPPPMLHDVTLRRTNKTGRVRILPIPGEEFLMDRRAVSLEDTPFCAHRAQKTLSDLVEMGYPWDKIKNLGEGDSADFNLERLERFRQEDELPYRQGNNYDPAMKEVWITEAYLKVDYDGDGIAELRKIVFAGESGNFAPGAMVILENEETDEHPFAALGPIPMPHKFYGLSIADQTMDLQLIKSTLWRASLDNMYNAIMPQLGVIETQVNIDDLLTRKPGGIVRMKSPDAIFPIPNQMLGSEPFEMISYIDQVREQRTGVQRFTAGPSSDALNNAYTDTATGANLVENSSQERLELVARCFAEIGVKSAFRKILGLVAKHQNKAKIIRLRGKWVAMDPREWDTEFDLTVSVGLGTGNRQQQLQGMSMLLNLDKELIGFQQGLSGPLLTAENVYNKLAKIIQYMGLKSADPYYTDPAAHPMPQGGQQKPDPHVQAAQIKAQADQATNQAQLQADQAKLQAQMQADAQKAQFQAHIDAQKLQMQMAFEREKMQLQIQADQAIALAKIQAQREIDYARIAAEREEFNAQAQLEMHQHATDTALKQREIESGEQAKDKELDFKTRTTPGAKAPPKIAKLTLHRGDGGVKAERHYDDGTSDMIHIERMEERPSA